MNTPEPRDNDPLSGLRQSWPVVPVWLMAALVMHRLDGQGDLASLAMVLVMASTLSSLWLSLVGSLVVTGLALLAFNWFFVPPRGTLVVELRQHVLLLAVMLVTSSLIAALVARLRQQARTAQEHARQSEQLRLWGDALRTTADPRQRAGELQAMLIAGGRRDGPVLAVTVLVPADAAGDALDAVDVSAPQWVGEPDADQRAGLLLCVRENRAMGPGTGWYEELPSWYLPLRGLSRAHGAALISWPAGMAPDAALRDHAQALCDQMGLALHQAQVLRSRQQALEAEQLQSVRNALLTAISHDYRTPLATIVGAASSLLEQADRLSTAQQRRLASTVVEQAQQLGRLTTNTLQLARLDAPGVHLKLDWESAEELVGAVLRRARQHDPQRRLRGRLEPDLPLLHCDAILMTQMLDNLVDNALKYSPPEAPVEVLVRRQGDHVVLAVRDRGPGVIPSWRERIFETFQRGENETSRTRDIDWSVPAQDDRTVERGQRGAGVGLAVCRAIARAHGGEIQFRARAHGGSSFECWLPIDAQPSAVQESE